MASDYTDSFAGEPYFIHKGEQLSAAGMTKALNTKEKVANKVTVINDGSTDAQYPSAKAVYASLDGTDNNLVHKTGNETITGVKTFGTTSVAAEPLLGKAKTIDAVNDGTKIASEAQVYKKQDSLTAEQLSLLASLKTLSFFPKGTILTFNKDAWDAKDNDFKQIWKVCDGTNGTPNLVNRFLRGAVYPAGGTGGADSQTVSVPLRSHYHTFTGNTATGYLPIGNAQTFSDNGALSGVFSPKSGSTWYVNGGSNTNGIQFSMTPTGNISTVGTRTTDNITVTTLPSYYTVIYIMKIS